MPSSPVNTLPLKKYAFVFCAGLLAVLGFAPWSVYPLVIFALALLFWQWQHASGKRAAAWLGFAFAAGLLSGGIGWIYIALHDYGGMPFLLALIATALYVAFVALVPACGGYVQAMLHTPVWARLVLVMPALWVLMEWLRGLLFTGLPWLSVGYAQVPGSPLAGYSPILGVYGVSLLVAVSAGLLVLLWQAGWSKQGRVALLVLVLLWGGGMALRAVEWTKAEGEPITVALVQGNIPQELKFREEKLVSTLENYQRLVLHSDARLIVLPETALPLLRHELPENYREILSKHARRMGGDLLIGAFEREHGLYYNSVFTLGTARRIAKAIAKTIWFRLASLSRCARCWAGLSMRY